MFNFHLKGYGDQIVMFHLLNTADAFAKVFTYASGSHARDAVGRTRQSYLLLSLFPPQIGNWPSFVNVLYSTVTQIQKLLS